MVLTAMLSLLKPTFYWRLEGRGAFPITFGFVEGCTDFTSGNITGRECALRLVTTMPIRLPVKNLNVGVCLTFVEVTSTVELTSTFGV